MGNNHWNDERLMTLLYGVAEPDAHLDTCPECGARWRRLRAKRMQVLEDAGSARVPERVLREQRVAVAARIEQGPRERGWRWLQVQGLAVAAVLIIGLALEAPGPAPAPVATGDAKLFEEVFSEAASAEPRAVAPLRGLFEVHP
ncbi:MAG: hypothetical protein ACRD8O_00755 [Bryobacteraceae bacterium]